MTQEDPYMRFDNDLHPSSGNASEDEDVIIRKDRTSVREMILRFERTKINILGDSTECLERSKDPSLGSLTSVVNPIQAHFQHLYPVTRSQDRNSNVSVNSILSNVSDNSGGSSSSGFISDRNRPHRPAPPPPETFNDNSSVESKSPAPEEVTNKERRFSFTTPNSSPIVLRRTRQPPVIRRKSLAGSQGHLGETHWSYGVKQSDLEKLLRLKRSETSDNEEEDKVEKSDSAGESDSDSSSEDSNDSDNLSNGREYVISRDDGRTDTISTDHSTDTLMNEDDSDEEENLSDASGDSGDRSNFDNVSIKSISSLDMIPSQKYDDSITVSSDEFGSEVCHAPNTEFLTVSAVNEWCVSRSEEPVLMPVESKKDKYRR